MIKGAKFTYFIRIIKVFSQHTMYNVVCSSLFLPLDSVGNFRRLYFMPNIEILRFKAVFNFIMTS